MLVRIQLKKHLVLIHGVVAQLVEHLNGIQKVRESYSLDSTNFVYHMV